MSSKNGDGAMVGLKVIRHFVGLLWIGAFVWGVVSLFRGDWAGVGICALLWVVLGLVFGGLHRSLERTEFQAAIGYLSDVSLAVALGDWESALDSSSKSVRVMESSFTRDRGQLHMAGPFAITLCGHAVLLGAVGRPGEADVVFDRVIPMLRTLRSTSPEVPQVLSIAEELHDSFPSTFEFQEVARVFHSFA